MEATGSHEEQWDRWFDVLRAYRAREGHVHVPHRHIENGSKLGIWVMNQRAAYRRQLLAPHYARRLEEIGFEWCRVEQRAAVFNRNYTLLKDFLAEGGLLDDVGMYEGEDLARWKKVQQNMYNQYCRGRRGRDCGGMSKARFKKLTEIGFRYSGRSIIASPPAPKPYRISEEEDEDTGRRFHYGVTVNGVTTNGVTANGVKPNHVNSDVSCSDRTGSLKRQREASPESYSSSQDHSDNSRKHPKMRHKVHGQDVSSRGHKAWEDAAAPNWTLRIETEDALDPSKTIVRDYKVHRARLMFGKRRSGFLYNHWMNLDKSSSEYQSEATFLKFRRITAECIPTVIQYLYFDASTLPTTVATAIPLYDLGKAWTVDVLIQDVEDFMTKNMSLDDFGEYLHAAEQLKDETLVRTVSSLLSKTIEHSMLAQLF